MGLLSDARAAMSWAYAPPAIRAPWAPASTLESWVWKDLLGATDLPITRAEAMKVPAMRRARNLLCGTIAQLDLVAEAADGQDVTDRYRWLRRTDRDVSMAHQLCWTADDLLFTGWSLWQVVRNWDGSVSQTWRIAREKWSFDTEGRLTVFDRQVPADMADLYCLIPGFDEGLLANASTTIRRAGDLAQAAANAAYAPAPTMELHYTGKTEMTDEQIDSIIARWAAARRGKNGGVAWTNSVIQTKEHAQASENLLIEGRNAEAVEIARAAGIPAGMLDAASGDSMTYTNTELKRADLLDFGCAPIMAAISARLSLDDMVPRGTAIKFEREDQIGAQNAAGAAATSNTPSGPASAPALKPVPTEGVPA